MDDIFSRVMFLAEAKTGIVFTIIAVVVAVLVFLLAKIASSLKRGGGFDCIARRIGLLDPKEIRFNLEFENSTKKDWTLDDFQLSYFDSGKITPVCRMAYSPLPHGLDTNFIIRKDGSYGFFIEKGKKQSAIVHYLISDSFSLPRGARLCFSCRDEDGRLLYALIDLKSDEAKLLSFKRCKS